MKVILNGKEVKCHSFADLKAGDVFIMGSCVYIKTNSNQCCSLVSGVIDNYNAQPIVVYLDAVLLLEPHKDCRHHHDSKPDCDKGCE